MNISKLSVKRPTLVVVVFTILLFLGLASYKSLNSELMPSMTAPAFMVMTTYPGASPSEVENNVTKKLEDAITGIENIEHIQSTSLEGVSVLGVSLKQSANVDIAIQDAQRRINSAKNLLPHGVLDPMVSKISMGDLPVMNIGTTAALSSTDFYDLLKYKIQPELARIKGVGEIAIIGGNEREIRVNLDAQKLEAYNLSSEQVLQSIQS